MFLLKTGTVENWDLEKPHLTEPQQTDFNR